MSPFSDRMKTAVPRGPVRTLAFVLGDQLDPSAAALRGMDRAEDALLLAEAREEAEHVPSHVQRTTLFLSAMRHFAADRAAEGWRVRYVRLDDRASSGTLAGELRRAITDLAPTRLVMTRPGEHRLTAELTAAARDSGLDLELYEDDSFTCTLREFDDWADGRREFVMEHFYRTRRRALDVLMENGDPVGGAWNFDAENRKAFRSAPQVPPLLRARARTRSRGR